MQGDGISTVSAAGVTRIVHVRRIVILLLETIKREAERRESRTKAPRRVTFSESPVERRGLERSDPEGGHKHENAVIKSRAVEDTGEDPSEPSAMSVHKLEMILAVKQK